MKPMANQKGKDRAPNPKGPLHPQHSKRINKQRSRQQALELQERKERQRRYLVVASVVVVVMLVALALFRSSAEGKAPDFTVQTSDGGTFTLSEREGKVVLVKFMFVACSACRAQLDALISIQSDLAGPAFEILSVSVDRDDSAGDLEQYRSDRNAPWLHGLFDREAAEAYGVQLTPTLVLIDDEGVLVKQWEGVQEEDDLRAAIDPLL